MHRKPDSVDFYIMHKLGFRLVYFPSDCGSDRQWAHRDEPNIPLWCVDHGTPIDILWERGNGKPGDGY